MKIYDNDTFDVVNDVEKEEYFNSLVENQIEFLNEISNGNCDIKSIKDRANNLQVVRFKEPNPKSFNVMDNGKVVLVRANPNAAAFFGIRKVNVKEEKKETTNAIYVSDSNSKHTSVHELFHALSANTEITYDENGKGYNKIGLKIIGYDKNDNVMNTSLKADALNEGMTEMLAMKFDNSKQPQGYDVYTYITDILNVNTKNSLLNAYFSNDVEIFKSFLKEFDSKQTIFSSKELVSMSSKENLNFDTMMRVVKACTEYSMSFCKTMEEYNVQKNRLNSIFNDIKENINVIENLDESETLQNNVNEIFGKFEVKIKESNEKTKYDIISDAVNATAEYIKLSDIDKVGQELEKYIDQQNKEYSIKE